MFMKRMLTLQDLEQSLGQSVRSLRLQKNLDRQSLCERAGVSVSALRHLETGAGASLKTLVLIVRALDRHDWLLGLAPQVSINPLYTVRNKPLRERASRRRKKHGKT
jgi:transcriptional regulator with XRE-family HTH domain